MNETTRIKTHAQMGVANVALNGKSIPRKRGLKSRLTITKNIMAFVSAIMFGSSALGQIAMTTTGNHSQNFNALASSGTTNTWTNNSTISNWYSQRTGTGTTYAADIGTSNGGNLYSYGASANSDRAIGTIGSSNAAVGSFAHGVLLRNTSGSTLTDLKVSYTLEQWRNGGNTTANTITFWYKTSSSPLTSLNPNSNTGWIQVTGLSLSSPINTSTAASLNGNAAANKVSLSSISIPSLSLANNDYIMLKWEDPDHTGTDHGLGIDDVTISWTFAATVTFDPNGGSGAMSNQTANTPTNLTSNAFSRTGYTFAGWNTAANGSGTAYANGASFPFTSNATLYAQWTANNLTVTYDTQGGSSVSNGSTTTGGTLSDPGNPTKSGFLFNGWYTSSSGGSAISFPYTHGQTSNFTLYAQWTSAGSPTLTSVTLTSGLTSTYGTASTGVSFTVSGSNLTGNITATAQSGYEVSVDNTTFNGSVSVASGATVYVRFSATQAAGTYNTGTAVVLSSSGATDVSVSTSASGNTVAQKTLTVSGLTAQNKVYDGLTSATTTGTASLSGIVGADVVSLIGTPIFTFASATVGTGKTISTSGYSLTGTSAPNYTLTQPSYTADITSRTLTITANDVTKYAGATLTGGAGSSAFTSSGLQNSETIGSVTISYGNGAAAGDPIGSYSGQVTPSTATGGTFTASNYTINYVAGTITVTETPITIAEWDFASATASSFNVNITAPIVSQGNNNGTTTLINSTSASSGYTAATGGNNAGAAARAGSLNTASNGSAYFEFTITPNSGVQATIKEISLGSRETSTGPKNFTVRSSFDNYTSDVFIGTLLANSTWALKSSGTTLNELIDLSQSRTFRIYGYNGAGSPSANTANWRIDDLKIMGYVKSVPQLSSPNASSVVTTSASLGATVTSDGGFAITSRGTVYGTSALPTGNSLAEGGTSVAAYNHSRSGLTPNTFYYFRGYAINFIGTGYSPEGTFTTIHNAPVVGSGSNASSTSIDANWSAPAGGSASFTYEIQVDDNNDFSSPTFTQNNISSASTSITATGLTPNTTYYFRVRANNAGGNSDWSTISVAYATLAVVNPTLSSTALTGFGNVCLNETSSANSFTINGVALTTDDVIVSSLSGYTFSTTLAGTYTNSLTLSQTGGSYTQEVFVKFIPTAAQSYSGNIVISGGGAASVVDVAASGTGTVGTLSLTTVAVSSLTYQGGISGGTGITASCGTITAKGIVYGLSSSPTLTSNSTNDGSGIANYSSSMDLTSFTSGQVVYYRSYATTSNGLTSYGNVLSLTVPLAPCSDLFISEYVEGSSNNKYIEIYNPTNSVVDLTNYSIRTYANGNTTASETALSGTIGPFSTFVLKNSLATAFTGTAVSAPAVNFNGDDAIALAKNAVNIDVFGQIGLDPGTAWSANGVSTLDKTLRRKFSVIGGDGNGSNAFDPSIEWDVFLIDNVSELGKYNAPSASNQQFCSLSNPTVSALQATGISGLQLQWFNQLNSTSSLLTNTPLSSSVYYVSQSSTGCESSRTAVTIAVDNLTYTANVLNGDLIWRGTSSSDYATIDNWLEFNGASFVSASTLPTSLTNVIIPSAQTCVTNQPSLGANTVSTKDLTIESGATLTMSNGTLNVHGNYTNNGTLNGGTGTVAFNGSGNQTITKTGGETFPYMSVNKASGNVILANDVTVSGGLTLTSGLVEVGTNNLVMGTSSVTGGSATSYVKTGSTGVLSRNVGSSATTFPVGNSTYNPAMVTNAGTSDVFSLRVVDNVTADGTGVGTTTSDAVVKRTWMVNETTTGGSNVTLRLYWNGVGEEINSFSPASGFMAHYISSANMWDNIGGTVGSDYVEAAGITSFSPFTISSSIAFAPLPIELVSFQANCKENNAVAVTWTTASEHNTSHYIVEQSRDGQKWSVLGQTAAAGNSTQLLNYEMIDSEKANGTTYYRLTQYDNDGVFEVFNAVSVNCEGAAPSTSIMTYPNPSDNSFYVSMYTTGMKGNGQLTITDTRGTIVYAQSVNIQDGNNVFLVGDFNAAPGMYYIQVSNETTTTDIVKHSLR